MASTHAHAGEIRNPGTLTLPGGIKTAQWVLMAVGLASFAALIVSEPDRAWSIFLINHAYFMLLALGGIVFSAIQWLTGAMWSAPVRRLAEALTAYLPVAAVTLLVVFVGTATGHIYEWTHHDVVVADQVLHAKSGYLNVPFFIIRNGLIFGLLWFFTRKLVGNSLTQDQTKAYALTARNKSFSPAFLIIFALGFTLMSFDQLMSLDPHWFSTIFGLYCFAGMYYSVHAVLALGALRLRKTGHLRDAVNDNHLHDIGKFMFAFTVFWAYIGFSQFMLIWYANLPEETRFYLARWETPGWKLASILLLLKFVVPFFALLPRAAKRSAGRLTWVACFMLAAQWLDILWLVQPSFFPQAPKIGPFEVGVTLGFVGAFSFCVSRFLSKHNVLAVGDPRLAEAVHHHHQ